MIIHTNTPLFEKIHGDIFFYTLNLCNAVPKLLDSFQTSQGENTDKELI